jgi:hypothetical protein
VAAAGREQPGAHEKVLKPRSSENPGIDITGLADGLDKKESHQDYDLPRILS